MKQKDDLNLLLYLDLYYYILGNEGITVNLFRNNNHVYYRGRNYISLNFFDKTIFCFSCREEDDGKFKIDSEKLPIIKEWMTPKEILTFFIKTTNYIFRELKTKKINFVFPEAKEDCDLARRRLAIIIHGKYLFYRPILSEESKRIAELLGDYETFKAVEDLWMLSGTDYSNWKYFNRNGIRSAILKRGQFDKINKDFLDVVDENILSLIKINTISSARNLKGLSDENQKKLDSIKKISKIHLESLYLLKGLENVEYLIFGNNPARSLEIIYNTKVEYKNIICHNKDSLFFKKEDIRVFKEYLEKPNLNPLLKAFIKNTLNDLSKKI